MERATELLLAGGAFAGFLYLASRDRHHTHQQEQLAAAAEGTTTPASRTPKPARTGWQWPVPMWGEYSPWISSGWGSPRRTLDGKLRMHLGVDLMYPRKSLDDQADAFPSHTAGGSAWSFMPTGIPALAARAGRVVYAAHTVRGWGVMLRHADGWRTFYQHLAGLDVQLGDHVIVGQVLGEIGGDPSQQPALRHLHFELRDPHGHPIDPKPYLLTWPRVRPLAVAEGAIATVYLPPPSHA